MSKIILNVELKPFSVPNFVIIKDSAKPRQEGICLKATGYSLNELDKGTLSNLCDEFRRSVFLKAGIEDKLK